jgi:PhnB protein
LPVIPKKLLIFTNQFLAVSLPIGKNNILMGTDACEEMGFNVMQENNFYICVGPGNKEEADKLFNALAEGGKINTPLQDMFWGLTTVILQISLVLNGW